MVTPKQLRDDALKCEALIEAFECAYLDYYMLKKTDLPAKKIERSVGMVYAIHDLLDKLVDDMESLSYSMEACNPIFALEYVRKNADTFREEG